jgi:endoglucanase
VSGPSTAIFNSAGSASTGVTGLVLGTYVFRLKATDNSGGSSTSDVTVNVNASSGTTTRVRIQAEAYSSMYGIQLENTSDAGGGQNVAWQDNNDWMDYSVNVASAGSYTVNFRVASMFTGAQFQLRNSSGSVLATVTVPNTGNFQSWQTVSATVSLPAGTQTLRIITTQANGGWNINWFEIVGAASTPAPSPTPTNIKIQAEAYSAMSGIQTENTSDAGGGQNVGWQDNNDWMDYSVNVIAAGTYAVNFRVASMFTGAQFQLRNASGSVLATVTVPNTGSFQSWQTVSASVTLPAGQQTLRIITTNANGGWNINWFEIVGAGPSTSAGIATAAAGKAEDITSSTSTSLDIYPNPVQDRFLLQVNSEYTGALKVQVVNMAGAVQKRFTITKNNKGVLQTYLSASNLPAGEYILSVSSGTDVQTTKMIKL